MTVASELGADVDATNRRDSAVPLLAQGSGHDHPTRSAGHRLGRPTLLGSGATGPGYFPSYACCKPLMSIFFICSMACMARFAFLASLSPNIVPKTVGMICQDKPYLSCSQPH